MPSDQDNSSRTEIYGFFKPQIGAQHFGRRVNANWDVVEAVLADGRDAILAVEESYMMRLAELEQRIAALEAPVPVNPEPPLNPYFTTDAQEYTGE